MKKGKVKFEALEEAKFKIGKGAFEPKTVTCSKCHIEMKKAELEITLESNVSVKVLGFACPQCQKRYMGLKESKKLDKAMIVSRLMGNDFKMERSISYDGDNWTLRIPKEFSHHVSKRKVEIMPLGAKQFCVSVE